MRFFSLGLLLFLLSGCVLPGKRYVAIEPSGSPPAGDEELFLQGLDELLATGETAAFAQLRQSYPQSRWSQKADQLAEMAAGLKALRRDQKRHHKEKRALEEEITQLKRQLEELIDLAIDVEVRSQ